MVEKFSNSSCDCPELITRLRPVDVRADKPKMIVAGAFVCRVIDWKRFRKIADAINAHLFVDMALALWAGFIESVGITFVTNTTQNAARTQEWNHR